jgi:predicted ATPase
MIHSLHIENLTVFQEAELKFGKNLNIVIGENGAGKSHILKAAYVPLAVTAARSGDERMVVHSKAQLQTLLADKLQGVFRPDGLWRLVRRQRGRSKCRLKYVFDRPRLNLAFTFSTVAKTEVTVETAPSASIEKLPVFLPTRELLTIFPGFVSLYETTHLSFEETWRDTCILLGAPLARGPREAGIKELLAPLEAAMGGKVVLDESGRFYLNSDSGNMEMHLVAEGLRKLATVARLIATGSLLEKGWLFWDEPEANLNPAVTKIVAKTIMHIAQNGVQVFLATHSLFLLRELHILQQRDFADFDTRCFGLHVTDDGAVRVEQGPTMDDIGDISSLDEELAQSDRYLESEASAAADSRT